MISLFASRRIPASYHRSGHFMISKRFESAVMASKIGVPVLTKELPELYESGQYFINPQFGYRGVVLFPQQVRVLHDKQLSTDSTQYLVLCDERDTTDCESVFHEMTLDKKFVSKLDNCDIVSHDNIKPFLITDQNRFQRIQHDAYQHFLQHDKNGHVTSTVGLERFKDERQRHLFEYKRETGPVEVSVVPFYLGEMIVEEELRSPGKYNENEFFARHVWQYRITITNKSEEPFRLVARKWKVHYNGETTEAKGRGVVGQHPMLAPESPIFKYTSTVDLYLKSRKDSGIMWGSYDFISDLDGRTFSVHIPKFDLTPTIIPAFNG